VDAFGEAVVLDDVGHLQVFVIACVIGADQGQRCLVAEIGALALHREMRSGEQLHRLATPVGALLAAAHTTLGHLECPLGLAIPAGMEDARPI
jgi:hypothetical protein